jgi:hypothetical protein
VRNLADTLQGGIERDFNHPSVIAWVTLNESWGVPQIYADHRQQAAGRMLYHHGQGAGRHAPVLGQRRWEQPPRTSAPCTTLRPIPP